VVWVGFDDNRELNLEGAHSALPIWTEFMKRAAQSRPYRDAKAFQAPAGIASAEICTESGQLAGANCPNVRSEVFIDGTQPVVECQLHSGPQVNYADRVMEMPASSTPAANPSAPAPWWARPATATAPSSVRPATPPPTGGRQN